MADVTKNVSLCRLAADQLSCAQRKITAKQGGMLPAVLFDRERRRAARVRFFEEEAGKPRGLRGALPG
ncbi:hypothetical protein [Chromobacterium sinusclupearum]|uniref:hypothetical protein n=1 Tax=Chromobacterium sinusclupearum TaxID=2077146 RepID=UPI0011AF80FC|nr:hypothetical protein [Chromobacterium sinusclupearum]